jgi:F0F1-type ATP synthase assembly protein I
MSTPTGTGYNAEGRGLEATPSTASYTNSAPAHAEPRRSTETKAAFKTTEFIMYIAAVAGVLIASAVVGTTHAHLDYFRADKAWFYIVLLTLGYMVSRGLAKSGSREHYNGS